jgi:preprotein translocase subunit SecD
MCRAGFAKLQGLPFDVIDAGGDLFRLTVREAAISERTRQIVDQSIPSMQKRFDEFGLVEATVTRQGSDRILVQMPGYGDPRQPFRIPMAAD